MAEANKAVIILAKCKESHKTYGIRTEMIKEHHWRATWAFPIKEASAKREGYDQTSINGIVELPDDYPGCPYCKMQQITICSCGHVGCSILKNGVYICEWCGSCGQIGDYDGRDIHAGGDL